MPRENTSKNRKRSPKKTLVIGVSGHRNINVKDRKLRKLLRDECARINREFKTDKFLMLSPLAEGADRIVADIVMAELKAELVVPLPLPRSDYEQDFPKTSHSFRKELKRASLVIEAPIRSRGKAWRKYTPQRTLQYAWAGAYVVEHCEILFAIWDGKPARGIGGTAHVVKWFLQRHVPIRHRTRSLMSMHHPLPAGIPRELIHIYPETLEVRRIKVQRK